VVLDWPALSARDTDWVPDVLQEGAVEQAIVQDAKVHT
jgi:hypothetical protein